MRRLALVLTLVHLTAAAAGCGRFQVPADTSGSPRPDREVGRLHAGGSTFIGPMMLKWTSEHKRLKGVEVNYQSVGSGRGIEEMIAREIDFGCSDAPMIEQQLQKAKEKGGAVVHIPLALGAVVPVYHLAGVEKPLRFTGAVLAEIYLGKITKWNDKRLQDLQEADVKLPEKEMTVLHRSDESRTTYHWAEYLARASPEFQERVGVANRVRWPVGIGRRG